MPARSRQHVVAALAAALVLASVAAVPVLAANLTLPTGGRVSIELLTSDATFHNTMSVVSPAVAIGSTGCTLEPFSGLPGVPVISEKSSQHGCRVDLDSDPATPGIQGFAAGT